MPNHSHATFAGHLGRDPSGKEINGKPLTEFTIAVNPGFPKDAPTMWIDCKAWGRKGEVIAEHHRKGDAILVEGALRMEEWERKDGSGKASKLVLDVNNFTFIKQGDGDTSGGGGARSGQSANKQPEIDHDQIPF